MLTAPRDSVLATIQGNALDSADEPLPDARVRLRDARYGRVAGVQVTDRTGLFVFGPIEPGYYVVELISDERTVLATSEFLAAEAGQTISTIVKLPFRSTVGSLTHTLQQAAAVAAAAASSGVLARQVTGVDASAR